MENSSHESGSINHKESKIFKNLGYLILLIALITVFFNFFAATFIALSSIFVFPSFKEKVKKEWKKIFQIG